MLLYKNSKVYPFGYGLSYTNFDWRLKESSPEDGSNLSSDSRFNFSFSVTNTGNYEGKDVIEIYALAPYIRGGIEKPYKQLVGFAKSNILKPGETQDDIEVSFNLRDIASYDVYDKNNNGKATYELDPGEYTFEFMSDAHNSKVMANGANRKTFNLKDTIIYDKDEKTNSEIKNRFTSNNAYADTPIDGSTLGVKQDYLTRTDFKSSFPKGLNSNTDEEKISEANSYSYYNNLKDAITTIPSNSKDKVLSLTSGKDGKRLTLDQLKDSSTELTYNWDLIDKIAGGNDKALDDLVSQMSLDEMSKFVENAGFKTLANESIGKPLYQELDGPAGLNKTAFSATKSPWTCFPSETVIGQTWNINLAKQMGVAVSNEGKETGIKGWYAPGVNLHRSSYNGRNYEYYSEDPLLSGEMGGNLIEGAKENGMYVYLKHFALAELGDNSPGLNVWVGEQTLREIYLKPFEIAVKKYKANGIMTSFNRIGAVWSGANQALLEGILKDEWGFKGVTITDWTKDGDAPLSTYQGIVAGNNLWLCEEGKNTHPFDQDDPVYMTMVKESVKKYVYTLCDTLSYSYHFNKENENAVNKPTKNIEGLAPWAYGLIALNIVTFIGLGVWVYFLYRYNVRGKEDKL